jgi:hypothetical protein
VARREDSHISELVRQVERSELLLREIGNAKITLPEMSWEMTIPKIQQRSTQQREVRRGRGGEEEGLPKISGGFRVDMPQDHQATVPKIAVKKLIEIVIDRCHADCGTSFDLLSGRED